MLRSLFRLLRPGHDRAKPGDLSIVSREDAAHLFHIHEGIPQVDWDAARVWRMKAEVPLRALAAAWLDELRDSLDGEYRRWRHAAIEGLASAENGRAGRVSKAADHSVKVVGHALRALRGPAPILPVAIIALATKDEYYSFISHFYPDEGEWGTSGGVYINRDGGMFPIIVTETQARHGVEATIAHELTHHALHGMHLPVCIEEGFTQMMEERVTGVPNFKLDREMVERHRERWQGRNLGRFLSGEGFHSSRDDEQELAYHLAQWIVRSQLSERPKEFFAFVRECGARDVDEAAQETLGCGLEELVGRLISGSQGGPRLRLA